MKKQKLTRQNLLHCAELFRICAHPVRLKIIELLMKRPMFVYEIMAKIRLTQAETSHHLSLLLRVGVLQNEREGKKIQYFINDQKLAEMFQAMELIA